MNVTLTLYILYTTNFYLPRKSNCNIKIFHTTALGPRVKLRSSLSARPHQPLVCLVALSSGLNATNAFQRKRPLSAPLDVLSTSRITQHGHQLWSTSRSYRELQRQVNATGPSSVFSTACPSTLQSSRQSAPYSRSRQDMTTPDKPQYGINDDQPEGVTTIGEAVRQWCLTDTRTRSMLLEQKVKLFCLRTKQYVDACLLRMG